MCSIDSLAVILRWDSPFNVALLFLIIAVGYHLIVVVWGKRKSKK